MKRNLLFSLLALAIFSSGFFFLAQKSAALSGSWKFIIQEAEDHGYWCYAKGASEVPSNEGNPYYFEERGKRQPVPYLTASMVGLMSRFLHVPVPFFYPVWEILLPFFTWLVLWFCLRRFWGYPPTPSAFFALFILLATTWVRDISFHTLTRFSRPGDALWMLMIWISFIMNVERSGKRIQFAIPILAAVIVWFNPFLLPLGCIVTFFELLRNWRELDKKRAMKPYFALFAISISFCLFAAYVWVNMHANPWMLNLYETRGGVVGGIGKRFLRLSEIDWPAVFFFVMSVFAVVMMRRMGKKDLSKLDRLLLYVTMNRMLMRNLELFMPGHLQIAIHAYSLFMIELIVLVGWFYENWPILLTKPSFRKIEWPVLFLWTVIVLILLFNEKWTFVRWNILPFLPGKKMDITNGSLFLIGLTLAVGLLTWMYCRFGLLRRIVSNKLFLVLFLFGCSAAGYASMPVTYEDIGKPYPFEGALDWLNKNAERNEVVLTVPQEWQKLDYVVLYTDQKSYIQPIADVLAASRRNPDNVARFLIYLGLLSGNLDEMEIEDLQTVEEKLRRLRLNYLLIDAENPFLTVIVGQLKHLMDPVYVDRTAIIFKIKPEVSNP